MHLFTLLRPLALASAIACIPALAQAPTDLRIALVIGNSAYPGAAALSNPVNDAKAMGETLRALGFGVVELRDGSQTQMAEAISQVRERLKGKQGIGMLYYAGHGVQLDWRNYMVPVDARLRSAADVAAQTVDLGAVVDAFKAAGNRMNILVLDACRDNPFAGTGSGKGLAQLDAPPGTFLAYATAPGNVAEDGNPASANGLYTRFLLEELRKPVAKIEDVFKRVRLNVRRQSEGRQIPWESTSLEEDFFFNTGQKMEPAKPDEKVRDTAFNAELTEWARIKDGKSTEDLYAFMLKYPNGYVSEQAQLRLEQLQKAQTIAAANRDGVRQVDASVLRRSLGDESVVDQIDGFSGARQRVTRKVTFADDNRFEVNNGAEVYDQAGVLLKNRFGTKTPGILQTPADMAVGKKWKSAFQNLRPDGVTDTNFWEYRVAGYETITVPEGTFKTYLVTGRGEARFPGGITFLESRVWYHVESLRALRGERLFRSNGKIVENSRFESVSFKRASG